MSRTITQTHGTIPVYVRMTPEQVEQVRASARTEQRSFAAQVSILLALGLEVAERKGETT